MKKVLFGMAMVGTVGYYAAKKIVKKIEERKKEIEEFKNELTEEELEEFEKEMINDEINDEPNEHKIRKVVTAVVVAPFVVTAIPCIMVIEEGRKVIERRIKVHKAGRIILDEIKNRL